MLDTVTSKISETIYMLSVLGALMNLNLRKAVLSALIWSVCYLYIRRYLNPEVKDYNKYRTDSVYGGLAAFAATLLKDLII